MTLMLILLIALSIAYAFAEANIDAHIIGNHKPINHVKGFARRASILTLICYACMGWSVYFLTGAMIAAGAFGIVFRLTLNWMRGLPYDYISSSNNYDRFWYSVAGTLGGEAAYAFESAVLITGIALTFCY